MGDAGVTNDTGRYARVAGHPLGWLVTHKCFVIFFFFFIYIYIGLQQKKKKNKKKQKLMDFLENLFHSSRNSFSFPFFCK